MENETQQHKPGGHYSGRNRIPNIHEFVASLDRDKRERDALIESGKIPDAGVTDHKPAVKKPKGRIVTDPVTGKEVEITDVETDFMKAVDDPMVSRFRTPMFSPSRYALRFAYTIPPVALCPERESEQGYDGQDRSDTVWRGV